MNVRIDRDERGKLDDVAITGKGTFVMEWTGDGAVFVGFYAMNGRAFRFWLRSDMPIECVMTEDENGEAL